MESRSPSPAPAVLALGLAVAVGLANAWLAGPPARSGRGECTDGARVMVRVELIFGLSRKGRAEVGEAEWREFVAREVTPRFPDGLTVLAGDGQWRNAEGRIVREPSRLLLVWASAAGDLQSRIEAIRSAWRSTQQQESVLKAESRGCVSF